MKKDLKYLSHTSESVNQDKLSVDKTKKKSFAWNNLTPV